MCFDLEDCTEIFVALFTLMFKIVNDEHSGKVKNFILDVLCPLITEADYVSSELLDIILQNIVEPAKSQRKNAYNLAKDLVNKTSDTLEPYIQQFFNQVFPYTSVIGEPGGGGVGSPYGPPHPPLVRRSSTPPNVLHPMFSYFPPFLLPSVLHPYFYESLLPASFAKKVGSERAKNFVQESSFGNLSLQSEN